MGLGLLVLWRSPVSVREHTVVWIEEPPPSIVREPVEQTPPPLPSPPEPSAPPPTSSAPLPLETAQPSATPSFDPAFGMDDAVETGGMAVASGSTLGKVQDHVVRAPEPPTGPVLVEAVPASVRPVVPRYPSRAEEMGIEANVVALVTTDASGNVVELRIEKSGGRDFDESVRRAVLSTRFVVPVRDGRAQAIAFRLPYRFRLD
jgi:protein TonB